MKLGVWELKVTAGTRQEIGAYVVLNHRDQLIQFGLLFHLDPLIINEVTNLREITGVSLVETSWTCGFNL
jgi:hypothetical protein